MVIDILTCCWDLSDGLGLANWHTHTRHTTLLTTSFYLTVQNYFLFGELPHHRGPVDCTWVGQKKKHSDKTVWKHFCQTLCQWEELSVFQWHHHVNWDLPTDIDLVLCHFRFSWWSHVECTSVTAHRQRLMKLSTSFWNVAHWPDFENTKKSKPNSVL